MKTLYMETTKIDPQSTIAEIQKILSLYGATAISLQFKDREVAAVYFSITLNGNKEIPFQLPCRWEPIFQHLQKKHTHHRLKYQEADRQQAKRVAWRQILRWVEAQLALVNTEMVKIEEVFLPYIQINRKETLYDQIAGSGFAMLEDKSSRIKEEIVDVEP